jgi:GMP synthase-like glutamine amidotransferase
MEIDMKFLALQHIACEPPGIYEDVLLERGHELDRIELDEGGRLPASARGYDGLIVMGGPMSANQDRDLPWLVTEKRFIRDAVMGGLPYWGVCLGSQLLAAALGARVYKGARPEVGIMPVQVLSIAGADPLFAPWAGRAMQVLQWHEDTFDLPDGGFPLASSDAFPAQAFRWGSYAYGLQFHLEVSPSLVGCWAEVPSYGHALSTAMGPGGLQLLEASVIAHADATAASARGLFGAWLDLAARHSARDADRRSATC